MPVKWEYGLTVLNWSMFVECGSFLRLERFSGKYTSLKYAYWHDLR